MLLLIFRKQRLKCIIFQLILFSLKKVSQSLYENFLKKNHVFLDLNQHALRMGKEELVCELWLGKK